MTWLLWFVVVAGALLITALALRLVGARQWADLMRVHTGQLEAAFVRAESRGAGVGTDRVMLPWDCSLSDYQKHHGMLLPMVGEAAWVRPEGRKAYFVGKVKTMRYEFLPQSGGQ